MRSTRLRMLVALVACVSAPAIGQEVAEARADIRATYDFEPSAMTFYEQARRAPGLSKLWDRYEKNREPYRQALRAELRIDGNPELLYCDDGMLLLAKSDAPEDQTLGLESIRRCSLAEIQHIPYFYTLHRLASRGVDVFDLQDYAFLYPLLVQPESTYIPRLFILLETEKDAIAQKSILRALWNAATTESEALVRAASTNPRLAESARTDAQKLLQGLETVRGWKEGDATLKRVREMVGVPALVTEGELRERRMARMRAISDEALYELEADTALLYRLRRGA